MAESLEFESGSFFFLNGLYWHGLVGVNWQAWQMKDLAFFSPTQR